MKKIIIFLLLIIKASVSFSGEEKSEFYIKLTKGDPVVLEKMYVDKFGNEFRFGSSSMVFSVKASNVDKLAFLELLKKAGMEVESTSNLDEYKVSIVDYSPKDRVYKIDSSLFEVEDLIAIQKLLGETVKGGRDDIVKINDANIPAIKLALKSLGYESFFGNSDIFIKELSSTIIVECDEATKKLIMPFLDEYTSSIKNISNALRIEIKNNRIAALKSKIESIASIKSFKPIEENRFLIESESPESYKLVMYLASKVTAEKIIRQLSDTEDYFIQDSFINSASGRLSVELNIGTYTIGESAILKDVIEKARRVFPKLQSRDVKIFKE